jgi:hypothetical protein
MIVSWIFLINLFCFVILFFFIREEAKKSGYSPMLIYIMLFFVSIPMLIFGIFLKIKQFIKYAQYKKKINNNKKVFENIKNGE